MRRKAFTFLVWTTLTTSTVIARAAGFATARFGGEHGNVTTTNPTALYYNPGALAFSSGIRLFADGTLGIRGASFTHSQAASDPPDTTGAEGANFGRAELLNVFGAPMLGLTFRFGNLALGAAAFVPFGGRVSWSKNRDLLGNQSYPLAEDGVQRWHSIQGALTYLYATIGAAYRFGPFSFGLSGNLIRASIESTRATNPTGDGAPDTAREGRSELEASGLFASYGVGAMLELLENRLWLGASYQTQPGLGVMRLKGTLTVKYREGTTPYHIDLYQALPDIIRLGARYRSTEKVELRLSGDVTRWSAMRAWCVAVENRPCQVLPSGEDAGGKGVLQNLRLEWRDTWGVQAGASYWPTKSFEPFVGIGFETAAAPDRTLDPELGDSETLSAALGARIAINPRLFVAGSYTHIHYFSRDNRGKSELANAELPTRRPDGGGLYSQWVGVVNVNVEVELPE